uniref:Uncharacterized protein n=1 Tax=Anguilla anguilla TaxID=7936 RepID=A0A0E9PNL4_ANGAN
MTSRRHTDVVRAQMKSRRLHSVLLISIFIFIYLFLMTRRSV